LKPPGASVTHRQLIVVDDVVPRAGWGAGYPRSAQIAIIGQSVT